tara:strand:- start:421 stop:783 length:363 start_codon:yes stop_codon:yes gene_type:complete
MKCYNCNNIISRNNNIYKGYDNNFCNTKCRLNIINELNYIDPENNNPQLWPQILKIDSPLKKTKSINYISNLELNNNIKNNIKNNEKHYYRNCYNIINFENKLNLLKYLWTLLFIFYYSK